VKKRASARVETATCIDESCEPRSSWRLGNNFRPSMKSLPSSVSSLPRFIYVYIYTIYLCNRALTPSSRGRGKLTVAEMVKKFPACYRSQSSITRFTRARRIQFTTHSFQIRFGIRLPWTASSTIWFPSVFLYKLCMHFSRASCVLRSPIPFCFM
jgi:hypothetical protein